MSRGQLVTSDDALRNVQTPKNGYVNIDGFTHSFFFILFVLLYSLLFALSGE